MIAQNATLVDYKPGEIIFVQGDMPVHLFIVLKGAVDIFIRHEDTRDMGTSPEPIRRTFVSYQKAIKLFGRWIVRRTGPGFQRTPL